MQMTNWQISPESAQSLGMRIGNDGFADQMTFHRNLMKALSSGSSPDTSLLDGPAQAISALRLEDLSGLLTQTLYDEEDFTFQRWVKVGSAFNVTYEWNNQTSYGGKRASIFYNEGGKPIAMDDVFERKTREIKFSGIEREVTFGALFQRTGGGVPDIGTHTTQTGTLRLTEGLETNYLLGRAELDTTGFAFDGAEQQIIDNAPAENVIDMRGYALTPGHIDDAVEIARRNFAKLRDMAMFLSSKAITNLSKPFRTNDYERRIVTDATGAGILAGGTFNRYQTQFGPLPIMSNVFIDRARGAVNLYDFEAADGGTNAPNVIPSTITLSVVSDSTSQQANGTYYYSIVSKNRYGTSVAVHAASGVTCTTGQRIDVAWGAPVAVPAGGVPTSYLIFRGTVDPTVAGNRPNIKLMREVAASPRTYADRNQWMPGTDSCFIFDGAIENLCQVDLTPFLRVSLATVTTSWRFMLLKATDIAVRNAKKQILFKNVGALTA